MSRIIRTGADGLSAQVVEYHGFVYARAVATRECAQDVSRQTEEALAQLDLLLEAHGTDSTRLLHVQIWLRHMSDQPAFERLWKAWLPPDHTPLCVIGQIPFVLADRLVEIVATACK